MPRTVLFLTLALCAPAVLTPCSWCVHDGKPLAVLSTVQADARYLLKRSALLAGAAETATPLVTPYCFSYEGVSDVEPTDDRFYTDYLCAYFPKADRMVEELFPTMCPEELARALHSIVYVVTHAPWRYFVNDEQSCVFEAVHVGVIQGQLTRLVYAIKEAQVNLASGLVCSNKKLKKTPGMVPLLTYLRKKGLEDAFFVLVALTIDTLVHQVYAAIKYEQYRNVYYLRTWLEEFIPLLKGSRFEQQYTQTARLFMELGKMLQQRVQQTQDDGEVIDAIVAQAPTYVSLEQLPTEHQQQQNFLDSFIGHYETNITGKFTHEYHPAVLAETARSFQGLESALQGAGMQLVGRLSLLGYEEQGITRYKTRYKDAFFSDEMAQKTKSGWSLKMFNRFGLLTGFLCKDANDLAGMPGTLPVTHINPEQIEIFDGLGTLFQEHAFGEAYPLAMHAYKRIGRALHRGSFADFGNACMQFWSTLYAKELKVTGKQHAVGTQDILFSIAYMRFLLSSPVPIRHFYIGPDITYPIETSLLHNKEATRHAQAFVQRFVAELKPVDDQKTAYVFCSFVDGVGKSTMLGNIQNALKHGSCIDDYEHVDNSSSQLATVFAYSDNVVIADLPAQVSHFTYKPDGFVYVDCGALYDAQRYARLQAYVREHAAVLKTQWQQLLSRAGSMPYDLVASETTNPELSYALNVHLLKKAQAPVWVSFAFEGDYYLFDPSDPSAIRVRCPLATAPSHGLKNNRPEQMIFTLGVRFPMSYQYFLDDLVAQLKAQGVHNVVMVDFLSMYSRSSRENIRVNYIIQQQALLDAQFSIEKSFYQDFTSQPQLLAAFEESGMDEAFTRTLTQEALIRLALFEVLKDRANTSIEGVPLPELTTELAGRIAGYDEKVRSYAAAKTSLKIAQDHDRLYQAYSTTREYITLQQFHARDLTAMSRVLVRIFGEMIASTMQPLWASFVHAAVVYADTIDTKNDGTCVASLNTGATVQIVGRIDAQCHDRAELLPLLRQARARWYAVATNLLYARVQGDRGVVVGHREKVPVLPLVVLPDTEGKLCFVQPLPRAVYALEPKMPDQSLFGLPVKIKKEECGQQDETLYIHEWQRVQHSHGGVFAYGHELSNEPIESQGARGAIVSNMYTLYAKAEGADKVLTPLYLTKLIKEHRAERMAKVQADWAADAKKHGYSTGDEPLPSGEVDYRGVRRDVPKTSLIAPWRVNGVKLFLQVVATLDAVCKDLDADFALRRGNHKDYVQHIRLMEEITLPWFFGLYSPEPLFESYEELRPLVAV